MAKPARFAAKFEKEASEIEHLVGQETIRLKQLDMLKGTPILYAQELRKLRNEFTSSFSGLAMFGNRLEKRQQAVAAELRRVDTHAQQHQEAER